MRLADPAHGEDGEGLVVATITPGTVAAHIAKHFPISDSMSAQDAAAWALGETGLSDSSAFEVATEQFSARVLHELMRMRLETLRFTFSQLEPDRLVGKGRPLSGDTPEILLARARLQLAPAVLSALHTLGPDTFELISAGVVHLLGGRESYALCAGDEGGIDIFGRFPLRMPDPLVDRRLLPPILSDRALLFMGQCKCLSPHSSVGPDAIRDFQTAVHDALTKYEGNPRPPSHRLPETYYRSNETTLKFLLTSGEISPKAAGSAAAGDIVTLAGAQIAQILLSRGVGVVEEDGEPQLDPARLGQWAESYRFRRAL